ncbi:hypothetical protein EJ070_26300 [Mesorhizobium sp. M1E.F.Ca.ET.045.02.1.1]|uniref:DUF6074 family protein n=1 Tax=Mesorhizobium sp. M1E.F.Ca.ET.045.02.1.1 TaxID=2493672 RepID=UPI000F74EB6B|nr:DUF6074 family protein [Mesorhizobium sp. M1E.F.Ca.ET.045.02.1.1]AZO23846.1 hypothetical protein EJ070_26300 [Mesorhizobium sp. M1E.F.Ca.ET.045.02.1.1]
MGPSIVPFPMAKSDGAVKVAVAALAALNGPSADAYWRKLITAKRHAMTAQGISEVEVDETLLAFGQEVFLALARRYQPDEGDAA